MAGFGGLRDLNDVQICWVMRFQRWSDLLVYEIIMMGYEISMTVGFQCQSFFCHYEISKTVGFGELRDLNDGRC